MSYYHYCTAEIPFPEHMKKEEIEPIFRDLLTFYGKTEFDDENTVDDVTIVLTKYPVGDDGRPRPCPLVVCISAQGDISSDVEDVLKKTAENLSKSRKFEWQSPPGCFVLVNADTMTKTRIPFTAYVWERKHAILASCVNDLIAEIGGLLPPKKHEAFCAAIVKAYQDATPPPSRWRSR
jgi:hypothetical protein